MTNEEAKQELVNLCYECKYSYGTECMGDVSCFEAKWTAIKALEQEPCEDAISRQAVDEAIYDYSRSCDVNYAQIMEYIDKIPSVNPQEPKTGHWIYIRNSEVNGLKIVKCSECGKRTYGSGKYCPNCGIKMVEPQESEDKDGGV